MREVLKKTDNKTTDDEFEILSPIDSSGQHVRPAEKLEKVVKLEDFLKEMGQITINDDNYERYIIELKKIYKENSRHSYSQITSCLIMASKDNPDFFEAVAGNIFYIHTHIKDKEDYSELSSKIFKLYDHISLEKIRILYISGKHNDIIEQTAELNEKLKEAKEHQEKIIAEQTEIAKKQEKTQRDYTAVLGVFAAIITTFAGGFASANSIFSNIDKASIYRLVFVICLLGLIMANVLHFLYQLIREVHFGEEQTAQSASIVERFNIMMFGIILCDGMFYCATHCEIFPKIFTAIMGMF